METRRYGISGRRCSTALTGISPCWKPSGLWETAEGNWQRTQLPYLIDNEALDWLLLAERLCDTLSLLPETEKAALLFHGQPPVRLSPGRFRELIGENKYRQYLNYFYGITAEEALIKAVEEEVRKEMHLSGYLNGKDSANEAFHRIYGSSRALLLRKFRKEKKYPHLKSIGLSELKEFTYWLFKYRLRQCDKARVASDTKKALDWLDKMGYFSRFKGAEPEESEYPVASYNNRP